MGWDLFQSFIHIFFQNPPTDQPSSVSRLPIGIAFPPAMTRPSDTASTVTSSAEVPVSVSDAASAAELPPQPTYEDISSDDD